MSLQDCDIYFRQAAPRVFCVAQTFFRKQIKKYMNVFFFFNVLLNNKIKAIN